MCLPKPSEVKTHNYIFGGLKLKINNFNDEDYLEELENENYKYKYKNRDKKLKESFALQDLLNEKQRKQILQYVDRGM